MMLDEQQKKELAEKISQQRKSMWKGEVSKKKRREPQNSNQIAESQQKPSKILKEKRKKSEKAQKPDPPKPRRVRNEDVPQGIPRLKTVLLVIIGLICAIAIGVTIGYLAASLNLIRI